jgi:hypothetical protein
MSSMCVVFLILESSHSSSLVNPFTLRCKYLTAAWSGSYLPYSPPPQITVQSTSIGTSGNSWSAQDSDKRNTLYNMSVQHFTRDKEHKFSANREELVVLKERWGTWLKEEAYRCRRTLERLVSGNIPKLYWPHLAILPEQR